MLIFKNVVSNIYHDRSVLVLLLVKLKYFARIISEKTLNYPHLGIIMSICCYPCNPLTRLTIHCLFFLSFFKINIFVRDEILMHEIAMMTMWLERQKKRKE